MKNIQANQTFEQIKFWQNHEAATYGLCATILFFILAIVAWIVTALDLAGAKEIMYPAVLVLFLFGLSILILNLRFFALRVNVDFEVKTIVVKGLFGVLTKCQISEIERIYISDGRSRLHPTSRGWIVFDDNRKLNTPHDFSKKGCYVRFRHTDKTEKIVRAFWKHPIKDERNIQN
ncbi:MAG: hypothetical protein FWH03_00375 [Firmicutes bacterium]|nr:hypothetical protein [Bacillota bacterium]